MIDGQHYRTPNTKIKLKAIQSRVKQIRNEQVMNRKASYMSDIRIGKNDDGNASNAAKEIRIGVYTCR